MIIKTTIRLTYNNKFIETSALKDGSQAINVINAINPFDSSGNVRLTYNNMFIETSSLKDNSQSINAIKAINPVGIVSADQAISVNNPFDSTGASSADQAISVSNPFDSTGASSADQLKNGSQQNFQDGTTSAYIHVDQTFDKVGLIKGYTRTITFPSVIFKPADPKNIKQIKVN